MLIQFVLQANVIHLSPCNEWLRSGPCSVVKTVFPNIGIPSIKKRQSLDFICRIVILVKWQLYFKKAHTGDRLHRAAHNKVTAKICKWDHMLFVSALNIVPDWWMCSMKICLVKDLTELVNASQVYILGCQLDEPCGFSGDQWQMQQCFNVFTDIYKVFSFSCYCSIVIFCWKLNLLLLLLYSVENISEILYSLLPGVIHNTYQWVSARQT